MRVAVTGGNGFIGTALIRALHAARHDVVLIARNPGSARLQLGLRYGQASASELRWLGELPIFTWDPAQRLLDEQALHRVDAVIHLAGENIGKGRWTDARKKLLRDSRVNTTAFLAESLPASVKHFLSASAVGIYPQPQEHASLEEAARLADETLEAQRPSLGQPFLEQLAAEWELAARAAATSDTSRRVVTMRIGIVLGPEGFLAELKPLYQAGLGGPIGSGSNFVPWIHVEDAARAMVWVLEHPDLRHSVNVVGPSPLTFKELSAGLARLLHRPHIMRTPEFLVRLALGEKAFLATASCAALPKKLLESGYTFRHTDCMEALADVLKAQGH